MVNLSRAWPLFLLFVTATAFFDKNHTANAENDHLLIIEIQIAGENTSDDFIKIYNSSNSDIFLGNYQESYLRLVKRTKSSVKDYSIKSWSKDSTAKIPAKGFFLWANSKNEFFSLKIKADIKTSQTLSKDNGIALRMGPENTGEIIDGVGWGDFNNTLFEGNAFLQNPEANQTLSRKKINGIYQDTNNNKNDFYLVSDILDEGEYLQIEENSMPENTTSSEESAKIKNEQIAQNTTPPVIIENKIRQYPDGVIFNEILPSPEGPDEIEEWIEIFNKNNFEIDLSDWQIKDTAGGIKTYIFPKNSKINAYEYLVIKRPDSKITLNNDGDGLDLIKPNNTVEDRISFKKSPKNASFNLTGSDWQWSNFLTPGAQNIIQLSSQNTENTTTTKDFTDLVAKKSLASVEKSLETDNKKPFALFLIALFLAVSFGSGILFLKRKILK